MTDIEIDLVPCLTDNYAVIVRDRTSGTTLLVDVPEAAPVAAALAARGGRLDAILVTHHHHDHVAGLVEVKTATGATVFAPAAEADRIPAVDRPVADGGRLAIGPFAVDVIGTPGHTLGHVSYHLPAERLLFSGDTLFALGCGRLFEGTAEMMWGSLRRLAALPAETRVYCGHEYTLSNAAFATTVDPQNTELAERRLAIAAAREERRPTLPSTIGLERETNPFLRADEPAIAAHLGLDGRPPVEVFAELRARKNRA